MLSALSLFLGLVFFSVFFGLSYFVSMLLLICFFLSFKWGEICCFDLILSMGVFVLDSLSFNLVLLSVWCGVLMVLGSFYIFKKNLNWGLFSFVVFVLIFTLVCSFSVKSFLSFYLFFEFSLIPTFFLIMKWGYQPERIQASIYMVMYTVCASLPLLVSILVIYGSCMSISVVFFGVHCLVEFDWVWGLFLLGAFFVKMPIYFTHLWLPKAHVEAPVAGSMILAGVLLKLGSYGLIRVISLCYSFLFYYSEFFVCVSLLGGVLTGVICSVQSDLKSLIAYSSIGHMGVLGGGILSFSYFGMVGSVIMMVAHGLCSSGMFFLCNTFYSNSKSRSVLLNKGILFYSPILVMFCFLIFCFNMSAPPSINLGGELLLSMGLISFSCFSVIPIMLMVFLSGLYSMYMFVLSCHGLMLKNMGTWSEIKEFDLVCSFLHFFPIVFLVLNMKIFI